MFVSGGGGRRERGGLQLRLCRSFSSPEPYRLATALDTQRAPLQEPSKPLQPLQPPNLATKVTCLHPDALRRKIERSLVSNVPFLIVDCRPFLAYNINHIRGAINVNCSDRFNRKRLQQGKAALADLATSKEGKELMRRKSIREVVVYDESYSDIDRLPNGHPLYLVLSSLVEDGREPLFLVGEYFNYLYIWYFAK